MRLLAFVILVFVGLLAWGEHLKQVDGLRVRLKYALERAEQQREGQRELAREKRDLEDRLEFCTSELDRWTR